MASITLSANTQALINTALSAGPGPGNQNYLAAYNAISNQIQAAGGFNTGTANWFSQAGLVNQQATGNGITAAGTFIINYTMAAAQSQGVTLTSGNIADASNTIASTVLNQLKTTTLS